MNAEQVATGLNILRLQLASILDPDTSERVLARARVSVQTSETMYQEYLHRTDCTHEIVDSGWGFDIRDPPLRFRETAINGYPFRVDMLCAFRWKDNLPAPVKRGIVMRLWALDPEMVYRSEWDAERLCDLATSPYSGTRVMLRFHFDRARAGASELKDHLQIGGIAQDDENCWLHPGIDSPRFPYPPSDLFLACEFVGACFYSAEYDRIRTDPSWLGQILQSQEIMLDAYYDECLRAVRDRKSVLVDCLWQRGAAASKERQR